MRLHLPPLARQSANTNERNITIDCLPKAYGSGMSWSEPFAGKSYTFHSESSEMERRPRMSRAAETSIGDLQRESMV